LKADVKSIVRNFAQKNRSKGSAAGLDDRSSDAPPGRPPKAPTIHDTTSPLTSTPTPQRERANLKLGEELIYSKKPRAVEYTPATLETYKQKYADGNPMSLSRGPDVDDENLLKKKATQEKVKQFSKELAKVNHRRAVQASALSAQQLEARAESKPTARSKALEFAKKVPKPKPAPKLALIVDPQPTISSSEAPNDADWEKVRELEERHFHDKERVERIREYMSQMAC
jgi:hypothetical protein